MGHFEGVSKWSGCASLPDGRVVFATSLHRKVVFSATERLFANEDGRVATMTSFEDAFSYQGFEACTPRDIQNGCPDAATRKRCQNWRDWPDAATRKRLHKALNDGRVAHTATAALPSRTRRGHAASLEDVAARAQPPRRITRLALPTPTIKSVFPQPELPRLRLQTRRARS